MYTFDTRIRFSEVDSNSTLTLPSLLNYFQDASIFHSEDLGLGVEYLRENHRVWVMSGWQIVVERFPKLCESVKVGTFPYDFKGFLGYRNFVMTTEDGEYLAKANSLWTMLDTETGKPTTPTELSMERYVTSERIDMDYAPRKVMMPEGAVLQECIVVQKHHLDTNHHVNNGQYVDMAMAYLPENFEIRQFRAEYKKQAFLNDVLHPYVVNEENKCVISLSDEDGKPYVIMEFLGRN